MFTTDTVLVLGAGASIPYGFPSGADLVSRICSRAPVWYRDFGIQEQQAAEFIQSLRASEQPSVDAFVEHRPNFMEVGKIAIAANLVECEQEANLRKPLEWYGYLLNRMTTHQDEFRKNRLAVITFNYDRSLEHYLFTTLGHRYGIKPDKVIELLKDFPIIHVHGRLGYLPWQSSSPEECRPYNSEASVAQGAMNQVYRTVEIAAKGIRIVSEREALEESPDFNKARELINIAKRIYFLGFGYHPDNVRRLRIPFGKENTNIEGSCLGMTEAEAGHLRFLYKNFRTFDGTCFEFLRNSHTFQTS